MFKSNNKLQALVFSLGLAAMMVPATTLNAQGRPGGLFGTNAPTEGSAGPLMGDRSGSNTSFNIGTGQFGGDGGQTGGNYGLGIGTFGQEPPAPLGSGLFIMAAAGAAYAFKKRKNKK